MKTPVLVAGGGPVGLAVAGDLGSRGIACTLVERSDGVVRHPKMDLMHPRTMEFCRRWGIVADVEAAGYNRDHVQDYAWVTSLAGGYELGREPFEACSVIDPPPQSPQHRERCPQNFFDPVMLRFAASFPSVSIRHETELVGFEDAGSGVEATVRDVRTGELSRIEADYLVGCDGGGSLVRERLGIGMSGNSVLTNTVNVIFRCPDLEKLHRIAPAYRYIFIGPEGTWCTIVAINGRDEWRFSFIGDANRREMSEADLRAAIERAVGCRFDFEILSVMPWTRRELMADRYNLGRVFLCGDAAHMMSPTGGFGMTTGMQEAVDLGWKLAAVLQGWGGPKLLASYEAERHPIAERNVAEASRNLGRMLTTRSTPPPREIFEPGPEGDRARRSYGDTYTRTMKAEWFTLGITLGYRYERSPIVVADGTPAPPEETSTYTQTSRPGARAPHVWLEPGVSTLDLFGAGFVLLRIESRRGGPRPSVEGLIAAAAERGVPLAVKDVESEAVAALYERKLVLVRPDGHVAWRGDAEPDAPLQVIDRVRGA